MIIGQYLLLELKLDLCFYDYTIKGNGGAYEGCTAPTRDPYELCDGASFENEELGESDHVLNSTRHMRRILDANYKRADLSKIVSNSKHLNDNEQGILRDVLKIWIPIRRNSRNLENKTCRYRTTARRKTVSPVPQAYEAVFCEESERLCQLGVLKKANSLRVGGNHVRSTKKERNGTILVRF